MSDSTTSDAEGQTTPASLAEIEQALTAPGAPFEMEEVTVRGQRLRTFKHAPANLRDLFAATERFDDRDYLVYGDERVTYREARAQVRRLSAALQRELGVRPGDRVAIAMRNYPEAVIAFWAVVSVGALAVPLNAWWGTDELEFVLGDSGAAVLIADAQRIDRIARSAAAAALRMVGVRGAGVPPAGVARLRDWAELLRDHHDASPVPPPIEPDDPATLFYTSGTTGRPKGALGTHRNLCVHVMAGAFGRARGLLARGQSLPAPDEPAPQKTTLLCVPLFHVTGCHSILAAGTAGGSKLVMMYRWDAAKALELIERERVNSFGGVPTVVWQVLEAPELARTDVSSVEVIGYGGAPAAPELVARIARQFPNVQPGTGYGLTESSAAVTNHAGPEYLARPDSVGRAYPVCDIKVVDEDGATLSAGEIGELWVHGPTIIQAYWNRPDATAETIRDGWLATGDIGRMDEDGYVYILDRAKEMLIRGGENIYCVEIEQVLFAHPRVVDAAVFGVPHRTLGEEVAAAVQLSAGPDLDAEALRSHVGEHLATYKVPTHIDFYGAPLPRNANGKIVKRALRDRRLGQSSSADLALGEWS